MLVKRILSIVLLIAASVGAYYVYAEIKVYSNNYKMIVNADDKVIDRLKKIRIAQKGYYAVNQNYAGEWDQLITFIEKGEFPIIQTKESILQDSKGKDSSVFQIDTIARVAVYDSIGHKLGFRKADLKELMMTPDSRKPFTLEVDVDELELPTLMVTDPDPLNPRRLDGGDLKPLKFGSLETTTLKGSWE